jgi:hypothetical protein
MARDELFTFPTTYACMNPHHFVLTQAASLSRAGALVTRPMDEMRISAASPQEDEFALLCLGARSPYEALIYPSRLAEALQLSDPRDLSQREQQQWEARFLEFASGVSLVGGGRPLLLKSPAHGCRIPTLTRLLPDAKFAIVVRDPLSILESAVRMWTRLFQLYGFEPVPEPDAIRNVILSDRLRYEAKLEEGLATLPENRFMRIRYEALAADPIGTLEQIYRSLDLEDFSKSRAAFVEEAQKREAYVARAVPPPDAWRERAFAAWSGLSAKYGYGSG